MTLQQAHRHLWVRPWKPWAPGGAKSQRLHVCVCGAQREMPPHLVASYGQAAARAAAGRKGNAAARKAHRANIAADRDEHEALRVTIDLESGR